jgi:hypothetical protein
VHVVFWGETASEANVYAVASSDHGTTFEDPRRLTAGGGHDATHPSVAVSPNRHAHTVWMDDASGISQIYYSRR